VDLADGLAAANRALDVRDMPRARSAMAALLATYPDSPAVLWTAGRFLGLLASYAEAAVQFKLAVKGDATLSHVEFDVAGKVVRLRDIPGSTWAADILDEFARGMYAITDLQFAPGDVAIDIGAHIGGVSVVLALLRPDIRIIAYEPSSSNFTMLCANLEENGITNVTPVQQAVMGEPGELTLTWAAHATAGSVVGLSDATRVARERIGWSSERVQCVTLDEVFATHGIDRCSWLKLDCESAEWGIMAKTGMLERIDRLSLELHLPASRQAEGADRCVQDFATLVNRVRRAPTVVVSSMVWVADL
jgi:FkbM family methyltransferase